MYFETLKTTLDHKTADEAYQNSTDRQKYLESHGYTVVERWKCILRKELKDNTIIKGFLVCTSN